MKYNKDQHFVLEFIEQRVKGNTKIGKFYCILNNKTYRTLGGLRNAIRPFSITIKEFYDLYYKLETEGTCSICSKPTSFKDVVLGYRKYCSDTCYSKSPENKVRMENLFKNPDTLKSFRKKRKVWWDNMSVEVKTDMQAKRIQTLLQNDPEYFIKRGHQLQQHVEDRCLREPGLRQEIINKTLASKKKNNSFRNGMTGKISVFNYNETDYYYQGYEDLLLLYLLENNIKFKSRNEVPKVILKDTASGYYLADIFLPELNLLIDVKSERTIELKPDKLLIKQQSAIEQGFNFLYFVISSKSFKKIRTLCENDSKEFEMFLNMLISSQAPYKGEGSTTIPQGSTLQAIGSGSAKNPKVIGL